VLQSTLPLSIERRCWNFMVIISKLLLVIILPVSLSPLVVFSVSIFSQRIFLSEALVVRV